MRSIALLLALALLLTGCGGGGGGSSPQPNPCANYEVQFVIEQFLPQLQTASQLLPFQGGWWGITENGAPTTGGTVFLRDPSGYVNQLTIDPPETGRYFTPEVSGTWEMWGVSSSGCTTSTRTFFVFPYAIEMVFGAKFVVGGQDWGIANANTGQGIAGTPANPVLLSFFDVVGNLVDVVTIDSGTLKFYTPMANPLRIGFVVGTTATGEVTPIRQFNFVEPTCDIGFLFPEFILPQGQPQQFDVVLFGASAHSGGSYIVRHDGDIILTVPVASAEPSFTWTPPYEGRFTIELELLLPCGSRSSIPYPVMVW